LTACRASGFGSPDDVAEKLGCTNIKHSQLEAATSSESVTCTFHGDQVIVSWFDSEAQEEGFKDVVKQIGSVGVDDPIIYGNRWAIWCTRAATCEAAEKAMS
jgi:hypothetical protein